MFTPGQSLGRLFRPVVEGNDVEQSALSRTAGEVVLRSVPCSGGLGKGATLSPALGSEKEIFEQRLWPLSLPLKGGC